ncbi:MAG: S41 family peptidase [Candidatus Limivicinus sp.]
MKKILAWFLALVLLVGVLPSAFAEGSTHTVEKREYVTYLASTEDTLAEPFPLYFLDGVNDLPYVEIDDLGELIYFMNTEVSEDPNYSLSSSYDGDTVTFERDSGYSVTFDFAKSTITFQDFNAFLHNSYDTTLIDMLSDPGVDENGNAQLFLRDKEKSFDRYGDSKVFDLGAYGIELVRDGDMYYIPLQTANDIFFYPAQRIGFLFNGEALFLAGDNQLFSYEDADYTELAELYYKVKPAPLSDAMAKYSYQELCMMLDNLYGLKDSHDIKSFGQTFWEIGFDESLSGNDAAEADRAIKQFIEYYLDDLHSTFLEFSAIGGMQEFTANTGMANLKIDESSKIYGDARAAVYGDDFPGYEEVGNTAYITFDHFTSNYYAPAFYEGKESGEMPDDTIGLIIHAHEQITREGSPIENVVLDLSNNTGGDVDAAVFVLGWFLGDAPFSVKDTSTGAMSTSVYRADTNLDRKFDADDTVSDKNLYCLISPVSFSCGNLVPAALKSSQKVTLLGRTSGGGSCVVQPVSSAWGTVFQISGAQRMSFLKNGSFYDIDQGIEPDYFIDHIENFYNRAALTDYINSLF